MSKKKVGCIEGEFVKVVNPSLARFRGSGGQTFYIQMHTDKVVLDFYCAIKVLDTGRTIGAYRVMKLIQYLNNNSYLAKRKYKSRRIKAVVESEILMRENANAACQGARFNAASFLSYCDTHGQDDSKGKPTRAKVMQPLKALIADEKITEVKEQNDFTHVNLQGLLTKKESEHA